MQILALEEPQPHFSWKFSGLTPEVSGAQGHNRRWQRHTPRDPAAACWWSRWKEATEPGGLQTSLSHLVPTTAEVATPSQPQFSQLWNGNENTYFTELWWKANEMMNQNKSHINNTLEWQEYIHSVCIYGALLVPELSLISFFKMTQ